MSHDHPGQGDPSGGRDEFDHFFTDRGSSSGRQDPDATAWAGRPYDSDRTHTVEHAPYVRPAPPQQEPQYDEYQPADPGYYQPAAYYQEPPQRKGAVWAPVAVIVASLAIVAVVIAIILNNSTGRMTQGAFTPTATVTETTTQTPSQPSQSSQESPESSEKPKSSKSGKDKRSKESKYATSLPGSASACPGSDSYGTGPATSCGFAQVVATLYNAKRDDNGNASFRAKSPTTHRKYSVTCHEDSYATCTTDTGAVVYVLHK